MLALLRRLADYTIARHYPHLVEDGDRYAVFYEAARRRAGLAPRRGCSSASSRR
jgi:uncharacterized protein YdiU (UPF0061 family)